jgi:hypothetical protein
VDLRVVVNDADERKCNLEVEFTLTEVRDRMPLEGVDLDVGGPISEKNTLQADLQLRYGDAAVQVLPLHPKGSALLVSTVYPAHEVPLKTTEPDAELVSFTVWTYSITGPRDGPDSFRAALLDAVVPADDVDVINGGATPFRKLHWGALQEWSGEKIAGLPLDRPFDERLRDLLKANSEDCELMTAPRVDTLVADYDDFDPFGDGDEMNDRDGAKTEQGEPVHVRDLSSWEALMKAGERLGQMGAGPALIAHSFDIPVMGTDEEVYHEPVGILVLLACRRAGEDGRYPVDVAWVHRVNAGSEEAPAVESVRFHASYLAEKQDSAAFTLDAPGDEDATLLVIVTSEVTSPASSEELEGEELELDEGVGEEGQ